jgi:hypothetical protein
MALIQNFSDTATDPVAARNPTSPDPIHVNPTAMPHLSRQKVDRGELTQTECDALIAQVESDLATAVTRRSKTSQSTGKLAAIHP